MRRPCALSQACSQSVLFFPVSFVCAGGRYNVVLLQSRSRCPTEDWVKRVAQITDEFVAGLERGKGCVQSSPLRTTRTFNVTHAPLLST